MNNEITGRYWIGADGNVWLDKNGVIKNVGTPINVYQTGADTSQMSFEANLVEDPNPPKQQLVQQTQQVDPNAAARAEAQRSFRAELPSALSQIYESAGTKVGSDITGLKTGISETMKAAGRKAEGYGLEQQQAEMNRIQGTRDVLGMTSRGLQSGQRMLAAKNAGSSSAVDALVKAYEQLGSRELGKVQQTYQLGQQTRDINTANLEQDINDYISITLPNAEQTIINNIVESTRSRVSELRAAAVNASLPDLVNIDNEVARVKADAQAKLAEVRGFVENEKLKYTGKKGTIEQARTGALGALNIATNTPSPIQGALPIYTRQGA